MEKKIHKAREAFATFRYGLEKGPKNSEGESRLVGPNGKSRHGKGRWGTPEVRGQDHNVFRQWEKNEDND